MEKLKKGYQAIGRTYKNHLDGYNLLPYLTGQEKKSPRNFFMYLSDDGDVLGLRYDNWKVVFMEQRCHRHAADLGGAVHPAQNTEDLQPSHRPFRARGSDVEHATTTGTLHRVSMIYGAQAAASQWAATFKDFPPIQKPNTFTLDDALKAMHETAAGMH